MFFFFLEVSMLRIVCMNVYKCECWNLSVDICDCVSARVRDSECESVWV